MKTYEPIFIVEIGGKKLPEDISSHIEKFSYEENEKKMDELKLTIVNGDISFVDNKYLQEGKEIRVRWGYVGNLSEVRTCTIKEISYTFDEEGVARMEITAYDRRHRLTGRASRSCWSNKKISEIVKDVAAKHNLKPIVEVPDDIVYEFVSEGAKNDLVFLTELANNTGCSVSVVNNELHFKPNQVNAPVYKLCYFGDKDGYLQSFKISSKAEKGKGTGRKTEVTGIDPLTKKPIVQSATQGTKDTEKSGQNKVQTRQVNVGDSSGIKILKDGGETSSNVISYVITHTTEDNTVTQLGDKSVPEKRIENETPLSDRADESGRVIPTPVQNAAQAKQSAVGKVKNSAMGSIEAEAVTIGLPYLKAKDSITIENIGRKFSGNWRITKVRHEISSSGYGCNLTLRKNDHEGRNISKSKVAGQAPKGSTNNSTNTAKGPNEVASKKPPARIVNLGK